MVENKRIDYVSYVEDVEEFDFDILGRGVIWDVKDVGKLFALFMEVFGCVRRFVRCVFTEMFVYEF